MNSEKLTELRGILAELYDPPQALLVASDAGLDRRRVNFRQAGLLVWEEILTEAVRSNRLAQLLDVVRNDYPNNVAIAAFGGAREHDRALTVKPIDSELREEPRDRELVFTLPKWPSCEGLVPPDRQLGVGCGCSLAVIGFLTLMTLWMFGWDWRWATGALIPLLGGCAAAYRLVAAPWPTSVVVIGPSSVVLHGTAIALHSVVEFQALHAGPPAFVEPDQPPRNYWCVRAIVERGNDDAVQLDLGAALSDEENASYVARRLNRALRLAVGESRARAPA